ncbi:hypothetical protein QJS04_geneDACA022262 [Acorus gramineus]|uniref:Uncharacterized protein n=1 Tax=Acorus gramineus TaxID=55184 RepID=A0AAV9BD40_ACOGR|nr:hypothetical protein QJS04_geneDACA022262 [Acorus gramineus]
MEDGSGSEKGSGSGKGKGVDIGGGSGSGSELGAQVHRAGDRSGDSAALDFDGRASGVLIGQPPKKGSIAYVSGAMVWVIGARNAGICGVLALQGCGSSGGCLPSETCRP